MRAAGSLLRAEYLLPLACLASAVCIGVSEFMTIFEFERGTSGEPLKAIAASERHYYALLVLAVFAVVALLAAVLAGSKPAATAVAVAGVLALLIFLLVDLPDVNQEGSLDDPSFEFFASKASPAAGFWLQMVGSIGLAVAGIALATLREDQLRAAASRSRRGGPVAAVPGNPDIGSERARVRPTASPAHGDRRPPTAAERAAARRRR